MKLTLWEVRRSQVQTTIRDDKTDGDVGLQHAEELVWSRKGPPQPWILPNSGLAEI
jgi:hypothetical protein